MSNGCKIYFPSQIRLKMLYVENGGKNILGVQWVYKYFRCPKGVKIFLVSNGSKIIIGVKLV